MLAFAAVLAACTVAGDDGPSAGEPFTLQALPSLADASAVALRARGPTLVNVWATWCGPCRREMASLGALDRLAPGGLRVVGVSVDRDRNLAQEFVRAQGIAFANAHDPGARSSRGVLGVRMFPSTFLVDGHGIVRLRVEGARDWTSRESLGRIAAALRGAR